MNKVYTRINWENRPSENTAIDEINLNKMDSALNEIDTRVVEHETTKANVASLNELINYWHIDETTGVITIHKVSGEQIIFDLNLEKVPVGFSMTDDGILIMTTDDGTEFTANIGSMIPILTFQDTDEIAVSVSGEGVNKTYSFSIKTGSIKEDKLQPNFLADCRLYAGNAENSALRAEEYAEQAKKSVESISNDAKNISFDDSVSQLGSDNVQGAIEKNASDIKDINSNLKWKLLNTVIGSAYVDISGYDELVIVYQSANSLISSSAMITAPVPVSVIQLQRYFRPIIAHGLAVNTTELLFEINGTNIKLNSYKENSAGDITSATNVSYYVR